MQQLKQIKSRQFQRHSTIDPIPRTTSFHNIDHRGRQQLALHNGNRQSQGENHLDLANIVHQILEMKPKTAFLASQKREEAKQKVRVQTIGNFCMRAQTIVANQSKPISILQILKNQKEKSEESRKHSTKKSDIRNQFIKIDNRLKNTIETHSTSRTKSSYKSSTQINFESININQSIRKKSLHKGIASRKPQPQTLWKGSELEIQGEQERQDKSGTQRALMAKTKLTINNIDKFVSVEGKLSANKKKKFFNADYRKSQQKNESLVDGDKSKDMLQAVSFDKKTKKNSLGPKIPDFIKASLQIYQQDSEFKRVFEKLNLKNAENCPVQNLNRPQLVPESQFEVENGRQAFQDNLQNIEEDNYEAQQNLTGAKLKLLSKEKRRTTRIGDYIRSKKQQVPQGTQEIELQRENSVTRNKNKLKSRARDKKDQADNNDICGWQQTDVVTVETLQFKD